LVLLADPRSLFDAGFQLSFLSVASILLYSDFFTNALEAAPYMLRSAFGVSLSAQILPLPLALRIFHLIPLLAPAANLLIVPLLSAVLWLIFATTFASLFSDGAGLILGHALVPVVHAIRIAAKITSHSVVLPSPTLLAMALYWGTVVWLGLASLSKGMWPTRLGVALLLFTATALCWRPFSPQPRVVFLDVGHGDAAFVQTPGGTTLLIDGGDRQKDVDYGARIVAPFLWANHLTRLDYVVASHADSDHIGGLRYVLQRFRVGVVIMGPVESGEPAEEELLEICRRRAVPVRRVQRGDLIPVRDARVDVLHPPESWPDKKSTNNLSVVLRVEWPGLSALFTGDIEKPAESSLEPGSFQADVVKAPHHGSRSSSSSALVRGAAPKHVILSTGPFSGRPLADTAVVQRYKDHGADVWRTDFDGGVTLTVTNGALTVEGAREQRGYVTRGIAAGLQDPPLVFHCG
jgi:competence protein ComEC